jgi:hypothetical protein
VHVIFAMIGAVESRLPKFAA